jgi:hypothetical protein
MAAAGNPGVSPHARIACAAVVISTRAARDLQRRVFANDVRAG